MPEPAAASDPSLSEGRIRLDREQILDAAEAITRSEGVGKLTIRRIGTELGADPTVVYRHFRNKQELLTHLADRMFGSEGTVDPSQPWREQLRSGIRRGVERYRTHPDLAMLLAKSGDDIAGIRRINENTLALLSAAGLGVEEAAMWMQIIENHVVGAGLYFAVIEQPPEPRIEDIDGLRRATALLPADQFPHSRAAAPYLFVDLDAAFDRATEMLLDAIAAAAAR